MRHSDTERAPLFCCSQCALQFKVVAHVPAPGGDSARKPGCRHYEVREGLSCGNYLDPLASGSTEITTAPSGSTIPGRSSPLTGSPAEPGVATEYGDLAIDDEFTTAPG